MTALLFPAKVTRASGQIEAQLLNYPDIRAVGASEEQVISALQELLRQRVLADVDGQNELPRPATYALRDSVLLVPLPQDGFDAEVSGTYLDFTKAEFDRVLASARLAEERAKQNGAFALAAIPLLSFLQAQGVAGQAASLRYAIVQAAALIDVIAILILVGLTLRSRNLTGIGWTPKELSAEQEIVYHGYRGNRDLLYLLQTAWISGATTIRQARDARFRLVDLQQLLLLLLVLLIAALLVFRSQDW